MVLNLCFAQIKTCKANLQRRRGGTTAAKVGEENRGRLPKRDQETRQRRRKASTLLFLECELRKKERERERGGLKRDKNKQVTQGGKERKKRGAEGDELYPESS